jgi:hypothetical protein
MTATEQAVGLSAARANAISRRDFREVFAIPTRTI